MNSKIKPLRHENRFFVVNSRRNGLELMPNNKIKKHKGSYYPTGEKPNSNNKYSFAQPTFTKSEEEANKILESRRAELHGKKPVHLKGQQVDPEKKLEKKLDDLVRALGNFQPLYKGDLTNFGRISSIKELSQSEFAKLESKILENRKIFAKYDFHLGATSLVNHLREIRKEHQAFKKGFW